MNYLFPKFHCNCFITDRCSAVSQSNGSEPERSAALSHTVSAAIDVHQPAHRSLCRTDASLCAVCVRVCACVCGWPCSVRCVASQPVPVAAVDRCRCRCSTAVATQMAAGWRPADCASTVDAHSAGHWSGAVECSAGNDHDRTECVQAMPPLWPLTDPVSL